MDHVRGELAAAVLRRLAGWDQHSAAFLVRDEQPRASDLRRGRLERVSSKRLQTFLTRLGEDIEIHIRAAAPEARIGRRGTVTVRDGAIT